jgi:hypothetical protein
VREKKSGYIAPGSSLEKKIAGAWKEVLGLDTVSLDDNFFDVGGNSLKAIQLNRKINEILEKEISIVKLFENPTILSLARYLDGSDRDKTTEEVRVREVDNKDLKNKFKKLRNSRRDLE